MTNDVLDTMPFNSYGPSLAAILMYEELYVQVGRAGPGCRRRWYHWLQCMSSLLSCSLLRIAYNKIAWALFFFEIA